MRGKIAIVVTILGLLSIVFFSSITDSAKKSARYCGQFIQTDDSQTGGDFSVEDSSETIRLLEEKRDSRTVDETCEIILFIAKINVESPGHSGIFLKFPPGRELIGYPEKITPPPEYSSFS